MGREPPRDEGGAILGGRLLHIARDTPWGCALRSHFYLGNDGAALGLTPDVLAQAVSDVFARALLVHCYNEFTFLSRFLPSLFMGENRDAVPVPLPW